MPTSPQQSSSRSPQQSDDPSTHTSDPGRPRQRVVVLGGGIAGLTAAYELSRTPELRARYDVAVYQMGFRLGGKLASGRNRESGVRNEEHGLHVWFGFYDNTFRLAREVYERWRRPEGCPFEDVWDFVRPQRHALFGLPLDGRYRMLALHFPRGCDAPGDEDPLPSALGAVAELLDMTRAIAAAFAGDGGSSRVGRVGRLARRLWWHRHRRPSIWSAPQERDDELLARYSEALRKVAALVPSALARPGPRGRAAIASAIHRLLVGAHATTVAPLELLTRRRGAGRALYYLIDAGVALLRGMTNPADGIFLDGDLDRINDRDFRAWLVENGASDETVARSPMIEALYDSSFQFLEGDRARPEFEAGTALRYVLRGYFLYKHAPGYLVDAGMGEALIAPLYEVLREQGVRVELFHRLEHLGLSDDRQRVQRLTFARQARAANGAYEPLFTHGGLRCWPTEPDWSQLAGGEALRARGVDFESRWSPPADDEPVTLELGRDFDRVVMALPLGSIAPDVDGRTPCREWLDAVPRVRAAAEGINLVPSVAAQLWFTPEMRTLGWEQAAAVIGWAYPLSIWCDTSPVLRHEGWEAPAPRSLAYLCGVAAADAPRASSRDREAPARAHAETVRLIAEQLERHGADMWPGARAPSGGFDWNVLHDPEGREGPARLAAQYVRVNAQPWDLCDGAGINNSRLRPEAHESGLENMALASTWTRTSVGTSSVEAAIMSGIAAARALGVSGRSIIGEDFMCRPPSGATLDDAKQEQSDDRAAAA